jgi:hypothetical protein
LKHFALMCLFALLVALAFAIVGREGEHRRVLYALRVFAEFVGVGLALAWLLYWIPW